MITTKEVLVNRLSDSKPVIKEDLEQTNYLNTVYYFV